MSFEALPGVTSELKSEEWTATWLIVPFSSTSVICQPFGPLATT